MKIMGVDDNQLHPGISMHKIPVKAGFPGVVFTVGMIAVFLLGVPELIYFQALAIVLGVAVALMLRFIPREAGFITLVVTGVLLVCLVYVPGRDAWREEQKIAASLVQIAPPPPSPDANLSFYPCDCRQYAQVCKPDATMKVNKRHSRTQ